VTATAGSGSIIYDGAMHAPAACAVTGTFTGDLTCANTPPSVGPNAGTTAIAPTVSGTGLSNFAVTSVNGSYTINQKQATANATNGGGVYNATPYPGSGTCSDGLTPVLTYTPGSGAPVNAGTTSFTVTCGDGNHNYINGTATGSIVITQATPTLTWTPNPLGTITYGTTLTGLLTASGSVPGNFSYAIAGTPVSNSTVLNVSATPYTLTATFTPSDTVNYVSGGTVTNSLTVQYHFGGFLQPIANLPVMNAANGGQTIPVKWQLTSANGSPISDLSSFVSLFQGPITCDAAPASIVVDDPTATTGATVFRFDGTQFIYNWQTAKSWKGCFALVLTLKDGTQHVAKFSFN
jgi:hypothetical protein